MNRKDQFPDTSGQPLVQSSRAAPRVTSRVSNPDPIFEMRLDTGFKTWSEHQGLKSI